MSALNETPREKAGAIVFTLATLLPGMALGGFFDEVAYMVPFVAWLAIATVGGAVGGAIYGEYAPVKTAICGAIAGGGIVFAIPFYTELRAQLSDTFIVAEFLIPMLIGALPGFALYKLWAKPPSSPAVQG